MLDPDFRFYGMGNSPCAVNVEQPQESKTQTSATDPTIKLYHPVDPEDILTASYRVKDKVIYVYDSKDDGGVRMHIVCTNPEDFDAKIKRYAQDEGYLFQKPRYHARESKVVWTIEAQKDTSVAVNYTIDGAQRKVTLNVPGLAKNMNIDLLRDIINTSVQNEIKRTRLVGLSGTFMDTSLSKLDDKEDLDNKEDSKKDGTN